MPELFEPCPTLTANNIADVALGCAELGGNVFLHHALRSEFSDLAHGGFREDGITVFFSANVVARWLAECAVIDGIDVIGSRSIPPQIFKAVVGAYSVLMARFAMCRARADKGFEYDLMNVGGANLTVAEDGNSLVSILHLLGLDDACAVHIEPAGFTAENVNRNDNTIVGDVVASVRCLFDFVTIRNLFNLFWYHTSSMYTFSIS